MAAVVCEKYRDAVIGDMYCTVCVDTLLKERYGDGWEDGYNGKRGAYNSSWYSVTPYVGFATYSYEMKGRKE